MTTNCAAAGAMRTTSAVAVCGCVCLLTSTEHVLSPGHNVLFFPPEHSTHSGSMNVALAALHAVALLLLLVLVLVRHYNTAHTHLACVFC
jgi:hypothetical protein